MLQSGYFNINFLLISDTYLVKYLIAYFNINFVQLNISIIKLVYKLTILVRFKYLNMFSL